MNVELSYKKTLLFSLLLGICTAVCLTASVSALSRTYFDDAGEEAGECDLGQPGYGSRSNYLVSYCDDEHRVVLLAGENYMVPEERTVLQANFKTNGPAPTGQSIIIRGAHLCAANPNAVTANRRDNVTNGYYSDNTADFPNASKVSNLYGKDVTLYQIGNNGKKRDGKFRNANTEDCGATPNITIGLDPADFEEVDPVNAPGWWFVKIIATHRNQHGPPQGPQGCSITSNTNDGGPCDGLVNSFRVTAVGDKSRNVTTYSTNQACGKGECVTLRSAKGTDGMDYDHHVTFKLRFGSACTLETPERTSVSFYDLDYGFGDGGRHVIKFTMRGEWPEQQADGSFLTVVRWWWDKPGDVPDIGQAWHDERPSYDQSIVVPPRNGDTSRVGFTAMPDGKYTAFVMNFGPQLAFQAGLPYDGVYYGLNCGGNATAEPHAELNPRRSYEPGEVATGTTWVTNDSSHTSRAKWERTFWYEEGDNEEYDFGSDVPIPIGMDSPGTLTDFPPNVDSLRRSNSASVSGTRKKICVALRLYDPAPTTSFIRRIAVDCQRIERKPYLQVLRGDVNTTKQDVTQFPCVDAATNHIATYWEDGRGSGSQIAAFSGGNVRDFVTAALRASIPLSPKGLTFANTNRTYGEQFGKAVGCNTDADWAKARALSSTRNESLDAYPGGGGTLYYKGTLRITQPIQYPTGSFGLTNMPYLKVVVDGDIYIYSNVQQIDGIYMATGTIYTCTRGNNKPTDVNESAFKTACDNTRLTVNGSLIANRIKFLRLTGGLRTDAAETITYDPLIWLRAIQPDDNELSLPPFDSYTTMPPVL